MSHLVSNEDGARSMIIEEGLYASGQVIYPAPQSQDMVCT